MSEKKNALGSQCYLVSVVQVGLTSSSQISLGRGQKEKLVGDRVFVGIRRGPPDWIKQCQSSEKIMCDAYLPPPPQLKNVYLEDLIMKVTLNTHVPVSHCASMIE